MDPVAWPGKSAYKLCCLPRSLPQSTVSDSSIECPAELRQYANSSALGLTVAGQVVDNAGIKSSEYGVLKAPKKRNKAQMTTRQSS